MSEGQKPQMPTGQPKVLLDAMYEVVKDRYEYCDHYAIKLKLQTWKQKAEIEDLKSEILDLKQQIIDLKMEQDKEPE